MAGSTKVLSALFLILRKLKLKFCYVLLKFIIQNNSICNDFSKRRAYCSVTSIFIFAQIILFVKKKMTL